jgi:hypothetical protein
VLVSLILFASTPVQLAEAEVAMGDNEEHCDLLPLAFKGRLRRQDLLGEVLGGVGPGRGEPRFGWSL